MKSLQAKIFLTLLTCICSLYFITQLSTQFLSFHWQGAFSQAFTYFSRTLKFIFLQFLRSAFNIQTAVMKILLNQ